MKAALVREAGRPAAEVLDGFGTRELGPGDVRVRIRASGVCHSDLSAMNGVLLNRRPFVLGHEGAGDVVEAGPDAGPVRVGDRVTVCWVPPCGHCCAPAPRSAPSSNSDSSGKRNGRGPEGPRPTSRSVPTPRLRGAGCGQPSSVEMNSPPLYEPQPETSS
jgi:Zn-dependent alcohol dehydrogenase